MTLVFAAWFLAAISSTFLLASAIFLASSGSRFGFGRPGTGGRFGRAAGGRGGAGAEGSEGVAPGGPASPGSLAFIAASFARISACLAAMSTGAEALRCGREVGRIGVGLNEGAAGYKRESEESAQNIALNNGTLCNSQRSCSREKREAWGRGGIESAVDRCGSGKAPPRANVHCTACR